MGKLTLAVLGAGLALSAWSDRVCTWPQLPPGALPDTEVSTNIVLHVDAGRLESVSLSIEIAGAVPGEVLVAVGHDADADGDLSFGETAFVFGCDCGTGYFVDYLRAQAFDDVGGSITIARGDFGPDWNLAKVVKRGLGDIDECVVLGVQNQRFSLHIR